MGSGEPGGRPGRARPPRRRGERGGGTARRAAGARGGTTAGAGMGPGGPGRWPGRARPPRGSPSVAVAVLPDGRVVSGGGRRADAGVGPRGPGRRPGRARQPRGRGVRRWRCCRTGGWSPYAARTGRVLVWDPAEPGGCPVELGRHDDSVSCGGGAAGRAGGQRRDDGRVLMWDPAEPGAAPVELGRHEDGVEAVAVLPDGRVVTGAADDGRVLVWDPGGPGRPGRARPPRRRGASRWRCCRTGGWSRAKRPGTGPGGGGGRVLVWDPAEPGARPGRARPPLGRGPGGGGAAGRAGGQRRLRRAGTGVGPGGARAPVRSSSAATTRVSCGGGAAGRAGGQRRYDFAAQGAGVGPGGGPGAGPVELGRRGAGWIGGGGAAGRAGGHRRQAARDGGCWCGTRRSRAPARSSSAATTAG